MFKYSDIRVGAMGGSTSWRDAAQDQTAVCLLATAVSCLSLQAMKIPHTFQTVTS